MENVENQPTTPTADARRLITISQRNRENPNGLELHAWMSLDHDNNNKWSCTVKPIKFYGHRWGRCFIDADNRLAYGARMPIKADNEKGPLVLVEYPTHNLAQIVGLYDIDGPVVAYAVPVGASIPSYLQDALIVATEVTTERSTVYAIQINGDQRLDKDLKSGKKPKKILQYNFKDDHHDLIKLFDITLGVNSDTIYGVGLRQKYTAPWLIHGTLKPLTDDQDNPPDDSPRFTLDPYIELPPGTNTITTSPDGKYVLLIGTAWDRDTDTSNWEQKLVRIRLTDGKLEHNTRTTHATSQPVTLGNNTLLFPRERFGPLVSWNYDTNEKATDITLDDNTVSNDDEGGTHLCQAGQDVFAVRTKKSKDDKTKAGKQCVSVWKISTQSATRLAHDVPLSLTIPQIDWPYLQFIPGYA
jgi:hypothetical protein